MFSLLFRLQTLILPLMLLPARYWPSALMAMAQISPGLFWSFSRISSCLAYVADGSAGAKKAQGVPTDYLSILTPNAVVVLAPYLHFSLETGTCSASCFVFARGDEVVNAEWMRLVECLYYGEVGLCGVVDVDAT
jgi:hypothetical protein